MLETQSGSPKPGESVRETPGPVDQRPVTKMSAGFGTGWGGIDAASAPVSASDSQVR